MADREQILSRRARFLTSALATALGCSGASPPGPVAVEVAPESSAPSARAAAPPPSGRPRPARPDPDGPPPLDTPPDAAGIIADSYARLASEAPQVYAALDQIEAELPSSCAPGAPGCADRWQDLADRLGRLEQRVKGFAPLCPGSSAGARRYSEHAAAHVAHGTERVQRIEDAILQLIDRRGWGAEALVAWKRMRRSRAQFSVCLSCGDW